MYQLSLARVRRLGGAFYALYPFDLTLLTLSKLLVLERLLKFSSHQVHAQGLKRLRWTTAAVISCGLLICTCASVACSYLMVSSSSSLDAAAAA
jgi:hypothetical protein